MAGLGGSEAEPPPTTAGGWDFLKHFGRPADEVMLLTSEPGEILSEKMKEEPPKTVESVSRGDSRRAVTGLPRSQTLKRQLSEQRVNLEPVLSTPEERRASSEDRRCTQSYEGHFFLPPRDPRSTASGRINSSDSLDGYGSDYASHLPSDFDHYELSNNIMDPEQLDAESRYDDAVAMARDASSVAAPLDKATLAKELTHKWILNLSMLYRDGSNREKFFVTYREKKYLWRRVTISLDYRTAPHDSLEWKLFRIMEQREKSAKIYEAIRVSIPDIQFFDTVTNLRLETKDDRLHIHVVEDLNEVIHFPSADQVKHLESNFFRERDIVFDSHLSGFVYKVHVDGQPLIKKEIPGPDTVDEFLYEVNALAHLRGSKDIILLHGVVVDDSGNQIKGLLISYAEQGSLLEIIYDNRKEQGLCLPWSTRQRWARQIVRGLRDIHESGFVQGDFTLNNIVVDAAGDAKIIDINRRGCPTGWEPPELKMLIEAHHSTSLNIGVKSDLFQLGMVLWALAMVDDEPETRRRPLVLGPEVNIPDWYRQITEICLDPDPRKRQAPSDLLSMFPLDIEGRRGSTVTADETRSLHEYSVDYSSNTQTYSRIAAPSNGWQCSGKTYVDTSPDMYEPRYAMRGRSPPSSPPSVFDGYDSSGKVCSSTSWAANKSVRPSYSDREEGYITEEGKVVSGGLRPETPLSLGQYGVDSAAYLPTDIRLEDISPKRATMPAMVRVPSLDDGLHTISTPKLSREDTVIHAPTRHGAAEMQLSKSAPETEDKHLTELLSGHMDDPAADMNTTTEMINMHTVSDTGEIKTLGSDIDGGVSLESGYTLTAQNMLSYSGLHSEAQPNSQQDEGPHDANLFHSVVAMRTNADMAESTTTTGREASADNAVLKKLQADSACNHLEEVRLGDFLICSSISDSMSGPYLRPCPAPLPIVLTGIGAGISPDDDQIGLTDTATVDDDLNALTRPATVSSVAVPTD